MTRQQGKKVAITNRRQRVADLYVLGWTQALIAVEIGVAQSTIHNDLKVIQKEWRASSLRNFDGAVELELQKLDRIEREAWEAWERSKQPAQSGKVRTTGGGETTEKHLQHRTGDPRYLDQVHKCISARCSLLGLNAPTKVSPVTPDGKPLSLDQRRLIIQNILIENYGAGALWETGDDDVIEAETTPAIETKVEAADVAAEENGHAQNQSG